MTTGNDFLSSVMGNAPPSYKTETIDMPGAPTGPKMDFDPTKFRVRYLKADLDDPGAIADLENICTKGLAAKDIIILTRDSFTFMDKYFQIVTYLEAIELKPRS